MKPLTQDMEEGLAYLEGGSEFYGAAVVMEDGTLREIGGRGRTWKTQDEFHKARGWKAGTVLKYFPAWFDCDGRKPAATAFPKEENL